MVTQAIFIKKARHRHIIYIMALLAICLATPLSAQMTADLVTAQNGMVASQHYLATQAGLDVLKEGGNAIDAAVTVGFTLAVTLPVAGNIGGGGFMVIHQVENGKTVAIDYREKAPAKAHRDMFLDENGDPDPQMSRYSYQAVGVPGSVAGMCLALEQYGSITLERALEPAIRYAEEGFIVDEYLHRTIDHAKERLADFPASRAIFLNEEGEAWAVGHRIIQRDLAWSFRQIAVEGPNAFYRGEIAERIADDMASNGGLITLDDLRAYNPVERKPVKGSYRGYEIYSMPPPSSGGAHIVQILNILENYPIGVYGHNTPLTIHMMAEAMKFAYANRSKYLGDPDFANVPLEGIIDKSYAKDMADRIDPDRATPSTAISPGNPGKYESSQTTHYSVVDRWGNAVSTTTTLNLNFGTGIVAAGTGILLNDEMDDFSSKPGTPNAFGLLGGEFNAIEPGKRMLSSMTPTIVMKDGKVLLVTGSPGGSRIITTTLQIVMNVIDHGMNIAEATQAVRIHHQWMPDELRVEPGLSDDVIERLEAKGHTVVENGTMGITQSIMRISGRLEGASDPRGESSLTAGY